MNSLTIKHIVRRFTESDWGGTETVVQHLCQSAKDFNDDVEVISTSALYHPDHQGNLLKDIPKRYFSYFYPVLPLSKHDKLQLDRKGGDPISGSMFLYLCRSHISIIHCHSMNRLAYLAYLIAKLKRVPFVLTIHGGYHHVPDQEQQKLKQVYQNNIHWGRLIDKILSIDKLTEKADGIICVGYEEYNTFKYQNVSSLVRHIGNGVNPETFSKEVTTVDIRQSYQIPLSRKILLNVGRIDFQKGQHQNLDVLSTLGEGYHLILCGPVTQMDYHQKLIDQAKALHVQDRLTIITDAMPESKLLFALYQQADVFLMSSIHEPFGIVILEAWASHLPVIANPVGGIKNLISHNTDGLLVDFTQTSSVAECVRALIQYPEHRNSLCKNAYSKLLEQYTWSAIYKQTHEYYTTLIATKQSNSNRITNEASL